MVLKSKITRTFLRTEETMDAYMAEVAKLATTPNSPSPFKDLETRAIKSFKHWVIIPNKFPYDAIAKANHLLITKREVPFDWDLLSQEELGELSELKKTYIADTYDVLWENLPSGQSAPGHFHLQLLTLKREDV